MLVMTDGRNGVSKPDVGAKKYNFGKKTPDINVRGAVNILNKQHNSNNCFEPPDHSFYARGFVFSRRTKKGVKQMKKLLTLTATYAILTAPAMAVQKCVALDPNATICPSVGVAKHGGVNWQGLCYPGTGGRLSIEGLGVCSDDDPTADSGDIIDDLYVISGAGSNCWCRIISPAISSWVNVSSYGTAESCVYDCAQSCGSNLNNSVFRSKLLGSISN